jgi:ribonuclease HI
MQGPEDILHLLFECDTAKQIWSSLGLIEIIEEAMLVDRAGSAVLEHLLSAEKPMSGFESIGLLEVIGTACWYLWWMRRQRTHGEPVPPIFKCKVSILSITANAAKAGSKNPARQIKWEKPLVRQVKINVDGSFSQSSHSGAAGAVMRDYTGNFMAASTVYFPNITSANVAEALAMKEGLGLASRLGANDVIMESDSLEIIDACSGVDEWWGDASAIFVDCMDLAAGIGKVVFKHCRREANEAAHLLARNSFTEQTSCN